MIKKNSAQSKYAPTMQSNFYGLSVEENLSMLAAIVESSDDAIISINQTGVISSWNKAAERLYGYTAQEIIGKSVSVLMPPNKKNDINKIMKEFSEGHRIEHYITQRQTKDGRIIDVQLTVSPLRDAKGNIVGASKIARDITTQMRAQKNLTFLSDASKLLASSLDYKKTLTSVAKLCVPHIADWCAIDMVAEDGSIEPVIIAHKDPKKIKWARKLRRDLPSHVTDKEGAAKAIRTRKAELIPEITEEMIKTGAKNKKDLILIRSIGLSSIMYAPLISRGRAIGVIELINTESKNHFTESDLAMAEELASRASLAIENASLYREAKEINEQLNIILQGVTDSIIVHSNDGSIIYANDEAAYLTGFKSARELLNASFDTLVKSFERTDEQGNPVIREQLPSVRALRGEMHPTQIIRYLTNKSEEKWLSIAATPVFDEDGNVLFAISISHDITEQKQREKQKEEFMGIVSHELKTPVTSLKAYGQVLQNRFARVGDEKSSVLLKKMDSQINKLTNLISDLLDVTKIQAGKLIFHEEFYSFDELVDEIIEEVQRTSQHHKFIKKGSAGKIVFGDRERIGQVITNFLTNAIKYSPDANEIIVESSVRDDNIFFSVKDFGQGIPKESQQLVFERFYRSTDPRGITIPGLGLGLYISSKIIARQHGTIGVESEVGKGSTFYFTIPIASTLSKQQLRLTQPLHYE